METGNENKELKVEVKGVQEENMAAKAEQEDALLKSNIAVLRQLRVRTDGLIHICNTIGTMSGEKAAAMNSLQLVRGWLGDVLEFLGEKGLNLNGNMSSFHDIESDTDTSEPIKVQVKKVTNGNEEVVDANEIQSINHVRRDVDYILNQVEQLVTINDTAYETIIFQHLRESKFWLDRELFRIKQYAKERIFTKTSQGERKLPNRLQKQKPLSVKRGNTGNSGEGPAPTVIKVEEKKDEANS